MAADVILVAASVIIVTDIEEEELQEKLLETETLEL
jgi:hypothetical protein